MTWHSTPSGQHRDERGGGRFGSTQVLGRMAGVRSAYPQVGLRAVEALAVLRGHGLPERAEGVQQAGADCAAQHLDRKVRRVGAAQVDRGGQRDEQRPRLDAALQWVLRQQLHRMGLWD